MKLADGTNYDVVALPVAVCRLYSVFGLNVAVWESNLRGLVLSLSFLDVNAELLFSLFYSLSRAIL